MVNAMCADMVSAGLAQEGVLEGLFDERLQQARTRLGEGLEAPAVQNLFDYLDKCKEAAKIQWEQIGAQQEA